MTKSGAACCYYVLPHNFQITFRAQNRPPAQVEYALKGKVSIVGTLTLSKEKTVYPRVFPRKCINELRNISVGASLLSLIIIINRVNCNKKYTN